MKLFGIWCTDVKNSKGTEGDWFRELPSKVDDGGTAILAFTSVRAAQRRAADNYGYDSYRKAKNDGWCEVKAL